MHERNVAVIESGNGPFGQFITAGNHVIGADEPRSLGGNDTGPDPYELVLAGLGACTAMTLRMYADRHKWPLLRVEVPLHHAQRASTQGGLADRFERIITLHGSLTDEQRNKLLEIAGRCPVSQTLQRASLVESKLAPVEQPAADNPVTGQ